VRSSRRRWRICWSRSIARAGRATAGVAAPSGRSSEALDSTVTTAAYLSKIGRYWYGIWRMMHAIAVA
jgi:hypothetical protein